jgi:hypothetical protein
MTTHATTGPTPPSVCSCGQPVHDGTVWRYTPPPSHDELAMERARLGHEARRVGHGEARHSVFRRMGRVSRALKALGPAPDPFAEGDTPITKLRRVASSLMDGDWHTDHGPRIMVEVSKVMDHINTLRRERDEARAKLAELTPAEKADMVFDIEREDGIFYHGPSFDSARIFAERAARHGVPYTWTERAA